MKRILLGVVGVALGLLTAVRAVDAAATRAEKCAAAELKAAGAKASAWHRSFARRHSRRERPSRPRAWRVPTLASRWHSPRSRRGAAPRPTTWPQSRTGWTDSSRACSTRRQAATETEPASKVALLSVSPGVRGCGPPRPRREDRGSKVWRRCSSRRAVNGVDGSVEGAVSCRSRSGQRMTRRCG